VGCRWLDSRRHRFRAHFQRFHTSDRRGLGISSERCAGRLIVNVRRQTANLVANIRSRKPRGKQLFNLSSSLTLTHFEQLSRILLVQVRRQRTQRTQMQIPSSHTLERIWKSPTHPRRRHSSAGRALAHTQSFDAVRKQRRKPELQMQMTLIELHQVRQHLRRQRIALLHELRQPRNELRIPDSHQSIPIAHDSSVSRDIRARALLPLHRLR